MLRTTTSASAPSGAARVAGLPRAGRTAARSRARSSGTRTCARGRCAERGPPAALLMTACEGTARAPPAAPCRAAVSTDAATGAASLRLRDRPDHAPCQIAPRVPEVTSRPNGEPLVRLSGVNKWFGELHVLQDIDLEIARGEVVVVIGPSGLGQVDAVPDDQPSRVDREGRDRHRRRAAARGGQAARPPAQRRRHGVPELQPLRAQDDPARTSRSGRSRCAGSRRPRPRSAPANCSSGSASPPRPTSTRPSSPAVSSSASRSPGRWRWTRRSCSSTSRPRPSTPR